MKNSPSKFLGSLTGKLVAETKALPEKTAKTAKVVKDKTSTTSKSMKEEFITGFYSTSGSTKKMG
jgi:hypothetical protein